MSSSASIVFNSVYPAATVGFSSNGVIDHHCYAGHIPPIPCVTMVVVVILCFIVP
jgi:hypothetical protein